MGSQRQKRYNYRRNARYQESFKEGKTIYHECKVYDADGVLKETISPNEQMAMPSTVKGAQELTHKMLDRVLKDQKENDQRSIYDRRTVATNKKY